MDQVVAQALEVFEREIRPVIGTGIETEHLISTYRSATYVPRWDEVAEDMGSV